MSPPLLNVEVDGNELQIRQKKGKMFSYGWGKHSTVTVEVTAPSLEGAAIAAKRLSVRAEIARLQALDLRLGLVEVEIRSCLAGAELPAQEFSPCELVPDSRLAMPA